MSATGPGLAVLAPLTAAACYGVASILQQVGARRAVAPPPHRPPEPPGLALPATPGSPAPLPIARRLGVRLLVDLVRQPLFLFGLGLDAIGFGLAFVGLRHLPVFVVQAAVSSTVAVTAVLGSRYLVDRRRRRDWGLAGPVVL